MIRISNLVKHYDSFKALDNISMDIADASVYGLVGINGAGKSTLLRTIVGIYKPDSGNVQYDGIEVYDNQDVKKQIAFVPDDLYLPGNSCITDMSSRYKVLFSGDFNESKCFELAELFGLDIDQRFNTFSKGMRRQAATILALARDTGYIFFDETFDGLDPFKRAFVKKLIIDDVRSRGATAIISSHSLRELSDICDKLAVLNKGGVILESAISSYGSDVTKVQVVFSRPHARDDFSDFNIIEFSATGSVVNMIAGGDRGVILSKLKKMSPLLIETLPLTIEASL